MASTYSTSLKLELIGDGDQSGIWGQTTNNNLGTLLEQAIAGVVSISMIDANYTLTNYNGVTDEARNAIIVATGTNTATRDIIAPLVEKTYVIKNSTTGGYSVRIIGVSGTGVTIPNGMTATVYCDATNFYAVDTGAPGNFTVVGNNAVGGNLTVTGTTTLTGALTGNVANLTSSTIANLVSGNVAFTGGSAINLSSLSANTATITTLTNTNLSSSNVTVTGGTINGVSGSNPSLSVGTATTATTATSATTAVTATTASNAVAFRGLTKLGLGITGEVWANTGKSFGTGYTNSNTYPIMVAISYTSTVGSAVTATINGVNTQVTGAHAGSERANMSFIVPAGATYSVSTTGGDSLDIWSELA